MKAAHLIVPLLLLLLLKRGETSYECEHESWHLRYRNCYQAFPGQFSFLEAQQVCANFSTNFSITRSINLDLNVAFSLNNDSFWTDVYLKDWVWQSHHFGGTYSGTVPGYFIFPAPDKLCVASYNRPYSYLPNVLVSTSSCEEPTSVICTADYGNDTCSQGGEWNVCHEEFNLSLTYSEAFDLCANRTGGKIFRPKRLYNDFAPQEGLVRANASYWVELGVCARETGSALTKDRFAVFWSDNRSPLKVPRIRSVGSCTKLSLQYPPQWGTVPPWNNFSLFLVQQLDSETVINSTIVIENDDELSTFMASGEADSTAELCLIDADNFDLALCRGSTLSNFSNLNLGPKPLNASANWVLKRQQKVIESDIYRWQFVDSSCSHNRTVLCLMRMTFEISRDECTGLAIIGSDEMLCFFLLTDDDGVAIKANYGMHKKLCSRYDATLPSFENDFEIQAVVSYFGDINFWTSLKYSFMAPTDKPYLEVSYSDPFYERVLLAGPLASGVVNDSEPCSCHTVILPEPRVGDKRIWGTFDCNEKKGAICMMSASEFSAGRADRGRTHQDKGSEIGDICVLTTNDPVESLES